MKPRLLTSSSIRIKDLVAALIIGLSVAGCAHTRSISNSGASADSSYQVRNGMPATGIRSAGTADPGFDYRGELNEFDVLGVLSLGVQRQSTQQATANTPASVDRLDE